MCMYPWMCLPYFVSFENPWCNCSDSFGNLNALHYPSAHSGNCPYWLVLSQRSSEVVVLFVPHLSEARKVNGRTILVMAPQMWNYLLGKLQSVLSLDTSSRIWKLKKKFRGLLVVGEGQWVELMDENIGKPDRTFTCCLCYAFIF